MTKYAKFANFSLFYKNIFYKKLVFLLDVQALFIDIIWVFRLIFGIGSSNMKKYFKMAAMVAIATTFYFKYT